MAVLSPLSEAGGLYTIKNFEDLSYAEIAELLNQPVGTVKGHVSRAKRLLQKLLVIQEDGAK